MNMLAELNTLVAAQKAGNGKWICLVCDYIYDEAKGIPEEGIAPGTPFDAIAATNAALLAFLAGQPVPATLAVDTPQTTPTAPPVLPPEMHD